eukprot:gene5770-1171_t
MSKILLLAMVVGCSTFPISEITLTQQDISLLTNASASQTAKDAAATEAVLPYLRKFFNATTNAIKIDARDANVSWTGPDQVVDGSCDHKVTAEHPKGTGTMLNTSYLQFGINKMNWTSIAVFADADVKVELGKHVFGHHCSHLGSKTVGIDVHSTGKTGLGLNMTAFNASVQKTSAGGHELVFNFHADVVVLVLSWNVDDVVAHNCKIKILGIDIGSYCGILEKAIRNGVNTLSQRATKVAAPEIAEKLEDAINTKIGSVVTIPLQMRL